MGMSLFPKAATIAATPVLAVRQGVPPIDLRRYAECKLRPDRSGIDVRVQAVDMKPGVARAQVDPRIAGLPAVFEPRVVSIALEENIRTVLPMEPAT